jgi:hypothetical protein
MAYYRCTPKTIILSRKTCEMYCTLKTEEKKPSWMSHENKNVVNQLITEVT